MSGTETRRRSHQIGVRLLPEEAAQITAVVETSGLSAGEILRRAYFDVERTAELLYAMNGNALYGRDLGAWADPTSDIGRNVHEQDRWRRQARHLQEARP